MAPAAAEPATAVAEELHWAGLPEEDLLVPLEEVMRMQDEDVGVEIEDDTQLPASSLGRVSANLPEDLSGRQSAEAEALERHTVFSTRVRAEALEQQKAEALKQQEAEALERQRLEAAASGSQSAEAATRPQASPVAKAPRSTHPVAHPP